MLRPQARLAATSSILNLPLTPYISVGQALAINQMLYLASLGLGYPGYNQVQNFALTPYLGVGQAAALLRAFASVPPYVPPFGFGSPLSPMLMSGLGNPLMNWGLGYGLRPGHGMDYGMMNTSGYGMSQGDYGGQGQPSMATYGTEEQQQPSDALASLRKHGGGLDWPLGLRQLTPKEESKELRDHVDEALESMYRQPGGSYTAPQLLKEVSKGVDRLDKLYARESWDMALTQQQRDDVKRFFRKVRDSLSAAEETAKLYQSYAQMKAAGGQAGAYGQQQGSQQGSQARAPVREVGVYDNYFEPKSIEVPAGTTVRWKNHGRHQHTVTSDDDAWKSVELSHETEFGQAFAKPGTYSYHCEIHGKEMRGTIVVK
jgi:plastocyanin